MARSLWGAQMSEAELLEHLLTGACALDEHLLARLLSEGVPATVAVRRATRGQWQTGAALLLGGVIALGGVRDATARAVSTPSAASGTGAVATVAAKATEVTGRASLASAAIAADTVLRIPALVIDAQPATTLYTVQPGDTLWGLAERFYGNGANWRTIYNANLSLITNPPWIYVGQVFSIPSTPALIGPTTAVTSTVVPLTGTATPVPTVAPLTGTATPVPTTVTPGSQTGQGMGQYTVKPGDSLWSIAQQAYGNPARWGEIYNANAGMIGPNPSLIFSGTVLKLP